MNLLTRLFAKHAAQATQDVKPQTAELFQGHAVEQFITALMELPDPDTVLDDAGLTRADLRRLESDDEISTALDTRLASVQATPWRLEPGEGDDYEFVYPHLKKHIEHILEVAWAAVPYGYSVTEIAYGKRLPDGRFLTGDDAKEYSGPVVAIEWSAIEERPFEWFKPMNDGRLLYYAQDGSKFGTNVFTEWPGQFFLTRRRPSYRQPYGQALLSRVYWPCFFRSAGWKFWARFLERFGAPLLIGQTANSTQDMAKALAAALQSAVAAIGKDDAVTSIAPGNAGESFDLFSRAVDRRIQKVILGQTLTTDTDGKGSYALGKVHDAVRQDRRVSDVRLCTATAQAMIDTLLMLNGRKPGAVKFVMEDETGLQADRAERDSKLAEAGIVEFTPEYLLRAYDFDKGDFIIPQRGEPGNPPKPPKPAGKMAALFATGGDDLSPAQQALEHLGDDALVSAGQPIPASAIRAAIKAATGPDDLASRLAELYEGHDAKQFQTMLNQALFAADVMGYAAMEWQDV